MAELIVAGETFNVVVEGEDSAPVLMLSNSLGTNLHMWDKQMPALTEHFRVVRYDARGHGGSEVTEGPYSIAQLGRDAIAIMDALGFERVHWLGLSMGGMVGQWLLTHVPERIGRAVLANTSAQMGSPDFWNDRISAALDHGVASLAPSVLERWLTKGFREHHPHDVAPVKAMLEATSAIGYAASCGAIRDMDQLAALPSVTSPVLVIVGRHDPATTPGMGALIVSAIPGAKLVTLDAAHLSNIEEPAAFNRAVVDFLTADEGAAHAGAEATAPVAEPAAPKKPRKPRQPKPKAPVEAAAPEAPAEPAEVAHEEPAEEPAAAKRPRRPRASAPEAPAEAAPAAAPAAARRRPAKKAPTKKAAAKKGARRAIGKRPQPKKAVRKAVAKKRPAARKSAVKKTTVRKAVKKATRKAVTKKTTARKPIKKVVAKKTVAKKATRKPVKKALGRRPVKKTGRKPGRPARKR